MKRENLKALGLTDEQIEAIMKANGEDIQAEKQKSEKLKGDSDKLAELQKQLDEINDAKLSEIEKANKDRDKALSELDGLKSTIKTMELRTKLAESGITGENATKLLDGLVSGNFDVSVLSAIITEHSNAAVNAKIKEIADGADNPGGLKSSGGNNEKSKAEEFVETLGKATGESMKASADIISSYLK